MSPALTDILAAAYAARMLSRGTWQAAKDAAVAAFADTETNPDLAQEAKTYYDGLVANDLMQQRDVIGHLHRSFLGEVLS